jgi:hypothetical protein
LCSALYRRRFDASAGQQSFLLEDLDDVSRTGELAESDREALQAVASWIKDARDATESSS